MKNIKYTILQILNILSFLAVIIVNILANLIPINGVTTGEVADAYPNLFTPASFTFAIWGLIYVLLGVFTIYQGKGLFGKKPKYTKLLDKVGYLFIISNLLNVSWLIAWHYMRIGLSTIIMLLLLLTLITIYLRLGIGRSKDYKSEKFFAHLPFSVYLGWISIATIANITVFLVSKNWQGFGLSEVFWTMLVIVIGTGITLVMLASRNDVFYSLVTLWALFGILIKRLSEVTTETFPLIVVCILSMGIILIGILFKFKNWIKEY